MKKIFLTLLSIYFLSFNSFAETEIAEISKIKNFVQIKRNDKWEKGDLLSSLFVGNKIRTGLQSSVELKYYDGTFTRIGSRSILEIKDRELSLKKGFLWGKVDKLLTKGLKIFTFSAVASILGTEFFVEIDYNKNTVVTVLDGEIKVKTLNGNELDITKGKQVIISKEGLVVDIINFDINNVVEKYKEVVYM
jgi:hypothetical protein